MITYKEFEVLRGIMKGFGKNGNIAKNVYEKTRYRVFKDAEEVQSLYDSLVGKGYVKGAEVTAEGLVEIEPLKVKNAVILAAGGSDITAKSVIHSLKASSIKMARL